MVRILSSSVTTVLFRLTMLAALLCGGVLVEYDDVRNGRDLLTKHIYVVCTGQSVHRQASAEDGCHCRENWCHRPARELAGTGVGPNGIRHLQFRPCTSCEWRKNGAEETPGDKDGQDDNAAAPESPFSEGRAASVGEPGRSVAGALNRELGGNVSVSRVECRSSDLQ